MVSSPDFSIAQIRRTSKTSVVKEYGYTTSTGGGVVASIGENVAEPNATSYTRYLIGTTTVQHNYITQNGKVVRETIGSGTTAQVLDFIYDANGRPFALKYTNGTADAVTYYYVLNLQGDVVGLIDENADFVAKYTYNAWGKILTSSGTMAEINPLRYRGYYYDTETGFYYLQSRYYDPSMHRFINADSLASTGQGILGTNMFAYCLNSPVVYVDQQGNLALRMGSGADFALFGGGGRFDGGMPSSPRAYNTNKTGSNQKGWAETGAAGDYLTPVKRINIFVEELAEQKIALVEKIINNDILMAIYHVGMDTYKIVKAAASFATGNYVGAAMAGASAAWHTWKAIDRLCCALELK